MILSQNIVNRKMLRYINFAFSIKFTLPASPWVAFLFVCQLLKNPYTFTVSFCEVWIWKLHNFSFRFINFTTIFSVCSKEPNFFFFLILVKKIKKPTILQLNRTMAINLELIFCLLCSKITWLLVVFQQCLSSG